MNLTKATVISAIGAGAKLLLGLVLIKIVALMLGPTGLGLMGQFMSITGILVLIAGGGIATGITKYVAEYKDNQERLCEFLRTARGYALIVSLAIMIIGIVVAEPLSLWLFKVEGYSYLLIVLSFSQFGMAATVFVQSVASGHADILTINKINIIGALIGVLILVPMIYFWGNVGMLIGLSILPVLPSFISVAIAKNKYSYVLSNEWKLDKQDVFRLAKYSLMVIVAATTMPLVQIILRGTIADRLGWEYVGYWQAVLRLSDSYLLFINMILASYFLPKLCELRSFSKQLPYAIETLKYLLVLVFLCCMGIWLFRYHIINLLFAESFLPAADLLTYQLIGDFFKVVSHSLGYIAVANAWFKLSIIGDVVQASLFLLFAWFLLPVYQELGVVIAYAVCYGFYFSLIAFIIFCSFHKTRKEVRNS